MQPKALLIGLLSGFATALLFAGLVVQSPSATALALAAPIPVLLASLGWGSASGFVASASAFMAIAGFTGSIPAGLMALASVALPSAIIGHIAGLARPSADGTAPNGVLDWFPIHRILCSIAVLATATCLFLGWLVGYDPNEVAPQVAEALIRQSEGALDPAQSEQVTELVKLVVRVLPYAQAAALTFTLTVCLYVSAAIVRASGLLARPKDDIPASTALPKATLAVFAVALAACFAGGLVGTIAAVVVGAFGSAFTLVGLASLHRRTRGRAGRGLILFSTYAAIVLLSFPLFVFTVIGLFETAKSPAIRV